MCPMPYRYPVKCDRYELSHPFQRWLVAKYEGMVDWSAPVRSAAELNEHVRTVMFPALWERAEREIVLARMNDATVQNLVGEARWRKSEGDSAARAALAAEALATVNRCKSESIQPWKEWVEHPADRSPEHICFAFLIVKAILQSWDKRDRRPLPNPVTESLALLGAQIQQGAHSPAVALAELYLRQVADAIVSSDDWTVFPRQGEDPKGFNRNVARLMSAVAGSGWCIAGREWATNYLRGCSFHILCSRGTPEVALRVLAGTVVECQGRSNQAPRLWAADIGDRCKSHGLIWSHRREQLAPLVAEPSTDLWLERIKSRPELISKVPKHVLLVLGDAARQIWIEQVHQGTVPLLSFREVYGEPTMDEWRLGALRNPILARDCPRVMLEDPSFLSAYADAVARVISWRSLEATLQVLKVATPHVRTEQHYASIRRAWRLSFIERPEARAVHDAYVAKYGGLTLYDWAELLVAKPEAFTMCPADFRQSLVCVDAALEGALANIGNPRRSEPSPALDLYLRRSPDYMVCADALERARERARRKHITEWKPNTQLQLLAAKAPADHPVEDTYSYEDHLVEKVLRLDGVQLHRLRVPVAVLADPALMQRWVNAWNRIVKLYPTFMAVVPEVLRDRVALPVVAWWGDGPKYDLRDRPWLLDRKRGLPLAERYHPRALEYCVAGWAEIVEDQPSKSYKVARYGRRTDMSFSLEFHPDIIAAATRGFSNPKKYPACWRRLSEDRRSTAWVQVAMARALAPRFDPNLELGFRRKVDAKIWKELCGSSHPEVCEVLDGVYDLSRPTMGLGRTHLPAWMQFARAPQPAVYAVSMLSNLEVWRVEGPNGKMVEAWDLRAQAAAEARAAQLTRHFERGYWARKGYAWVVIEDVKGRPGPA